MKHVLLSTIVAIVSLLTVDLTAAEPKEAEAMASAKLDAANKTNFDQRQACKLVAEAWNLVSDLESSETKERAKKASEKCAQFKKYHPMAHSDFQFNGVEWGMSPKKVKDAMKAAGWEFYEKRSSEDRLAFVGEIDSKEFVTVVYFVDEKAAQIGVSYIERHTSKNVYLNVFDRMGDLLGSKYGKPVDEDTIISNDLFADDPAKYGLAVSIGHITSFKDFYTGLRSTARLALFGSDYKINVVIYYKGPLSKKLEEASKKKAASGL